MPQDRRSSRHEGDLLAQGAYFRYAVKTDDLAQLTGRNMPQTLRAPDARKRHESQGQEDVKATVEAHRRQLQVPIDSAQQSVGT